MVRIDYQNINTTMWVNPDLTTFDYLNPTAPHATYANLAPVFDAIAIYTRNPANVDELSIISVPEPAFGALLLIGAAVFLRGRRKCSTAFQPRNSDKE